MITKISHFNCLIVSKEVALDGSNIQLAAYLLLEDGEQIVDPKDAEQPSLKYANGTF